MENTNKKCTQCGYTKDLEAYYKDARRKDGKMSMCKQCFKSNLIERNKTPEKKQKIKAYLEKPEVKKRRYEYNKAYSRLESVREKRRVYHRTEHAKALRKKRRLKKLMNLRERL